MFNIDIINRRHSTIQPPVVTPIRPQPAAPPAMAENHGPSLQTLEELGLAHRSR